MLQEQVRDTPIFSPSLMCMDITRTLEELHVMNRHCGMYHVDIMDGHFVGNISLCVDFVRAIRQAAKLPIDVHLMVTDPQNFILPLVNAGADYISVHAETIHVNAFRLLGKIREKGCRAGVCVCPATPASAIQPYICAVDLVTVMTVDPGYSGQTFIPQMADKVAEIRKMSKALNPSLLIQCDGGIGPDSYKSLYDAGARAFVMGTTGLFYKGTPLEDNCLRMKKEFSLATGVKL